MQALNMNTFCCAPQILCVSEAHQETQLMTALRSVKFLLSDVPQKRNNTKHQKPCCRTCCVFHCSVKVRRNVVFDAYLETKVNYGFLPFSALKSLHLKHELALVYHRRPLSFQMKSMDLTWCVFVLKEG